MSNPKVTVLMPSLNVADYIKECIESVISQDLKEIEIICIDAGSTDGTLEILKHYSQVDSRIQLIKSDKKSYGYQMNLGLDASKGEYIGIVETDDWIEKNMFSSLYEEAEKNDVDLVKCNYYWYYTKPKVKNKKFENLSGLPYRKVINPANSPLFLSLTPSIWSGLYKREFLKNNNIRFNETPGASYQDASFYLMTCMMAKTAVFIPDFLLHYRRDNESSSVNNPGKVYCVCDEMHYFEKYLKENESTDLISSYLPAKYDKYLWNFKRVAPEYQWEFLKTFHEEFVNHKNARELNKEYFDEASWKNIVEIVDNPIRFFKNNCKIYSSRPIADEEFPGEVIIQSSIKQPDVSVIIPVFNDEEYLHNSIESVLAQTNKNIEVIIVDDGSNDSSLELIKQYAQKDDRVTVITQMNKGLSSARNTGMKVAKGRYIQFTDSDDSLHKEALEHLAKVAEAKKLDILYFDGESVFENNELEEKHAYYRDAYELNIDVPNTLSGTDYFCLVREKNKYRSSACMALFRRSYLEANNICFIEGILHEDNAFSFEAMMKAERVWHVKDKYYRRLVHSGSVMTSQKSFFNIYGYLLSLIQITNLAYSIKYNERVMNNVLLEIDSLKVLLCNTYKGLSDKKGCRKKFTALELQRLDTYLQTDANKHKKELKKIKNSRTYKFGNKMASPIRMIKKLISYLKKNGIKKTIKKIIYRIPNWKNRNPKVLFVSSDSFNMSGAFLSQLKLNKILNDSFGVITHVILPYNGSGNKLAKSMDVKAHVIPSNDWIVPIDMDRDAAVISKKYDEHTENLKAAVKIAEYAIKHDYSIIHSNTTYTYVGYLASRITGIPHVWHLREFLEEDQGKQIYNKKKGYGMIRKSERVVTISNALKEKYRSVVPEEKLKCIFNGIDKNVFYNANKTPFMSNKIIILFVSGSESEFKGRRDLIEACKLLKEITDPVELWFVGWCGQPLRDAVSKEGLDANTKYFGYQEDVTSFYKEADIFCMCSKFEAFGRTTVEAMMGGCLVIGTKSAGTLDIIKNNSTGLMYTYGDARGLFEKIKYCIDNRTDAQKIASDGRQFVIMHMTAEQNAKNINDLYTDILRTKRPISYARILWAKIVILFIKLYCKIRTHLISPIYKRKVKNESINNDEVQRQEQLKGNCSPKISVIVPIYNVKKYLAQCINSILNQSLRNIEIICVNDGSTDGSDLLLEEYRKKDNRIVVINKENSGYGASVNQGINIAKGEYISIVESDDFIEPEMYENLYNLALENGKVDIVKSSYWLYYDNDNGTGQKKEPPILNACRPPKTVFNVFEYPEIIYHHPSIWSCIYKRSFMEDNHIRFIEAKGAGWVDNPFLIETFTKAKTISWTPDAYYNYRQTNPNASSFIKDCSMPFERTTEMLNYLDSNGIGDYAVRGSVYKRILYNTAETLDNPYYNSEKDDGIIIEQLSRIPVGFLRENRVRTKEKEAYTLFMEKRQISQN